MKKLFFLTILFATFFSFSYQVHACSVLYYVDSLSGKIYIVNNEDYWYDVHAYISIEVRTKNKLARLWYGWDNFAQGGVNEAGLFFDGAVTPEQKKISGYNNPKGNLGDDILSQCTTVDEALKYLEERKIGLTRGHMMFGDKFGKAVVVEWVRGERKLQWMTSNKLIMTNYLLLDTTAGNYPCYRYESIERKIEELERKGEPISLQQIGNTVGQAVQPPKADQNGRVGGTLYTSFINISDMEFVLAYKLSNKNLVKLDLKKEFEKGKSQQLILKEE